MSTSGDPDAVDVGTPAVSTDPAAARLIRPHRPGLVIVAAVVTVTCWASAFIGIRSAGVYFHAGSMALLRLAVGALALTVIARNRGIKLPPRRSWPLIVAWGLAWFAGYNLALNTAERMLDAGTSAMIVNLAPLIVVLLGGLLLGEGFPRRLLVGAPLSFAGVVLIGLSASDGGHVELSGVLLALLSALIYASCTLLQKHLLKTVHATTLTWLGVVVGALALLPWSGQVVTDVAHAPWTATACVVYLGLFPTAIAFTTWAYVLSRSSAGTTSATTYAVPALTVLMSWGLLGEAPTPIKLLGGALCLVGVMITHARIRVRPRT